MAFPKPYQVPDTNNISLDCVHAAQWYPYPAAVVHEIMDKATHAVNLALVQGDRTIPDPVFFPHHSFSYEDGTGEVALEIWLKPDRTHVSELETVYRGFSYIERTYGYGLMQCVIFREADTRLGTCNLQPPNYSATH